MCWLKLIRSPTAVKNREWWRVDKLFLAPNLLLARGPGWSTGLPETTGLPDKIGLAGKKLDHIAI
jgi:hypothetical protein